MPYDVSKVKGGFRVTSAKHPQGFSKSPQTAKEAHIQKWIIEKSMAGKEGGGGSSPKKVGVKKSGG